ncbi:MAG: hypothetical protein WBC85_16775 [Planktotalea sp.]|uniref:hypothetical protein n=1 Tax=Planktotalea sp. TaxID=2029877 RepID=UPI003C7425F8
MSSSDKSGEASPTGGVVTETILDDPQLLLQFRKGRSERLVVVFSSYAPKKKWRDVKTTAFSGSASQHGLHNVLFVVDKPGSFGLAPKLMTRVEKAARELCRQHGLNRVDVLGSSMGAYSGFLFADLLEVEVMVALAPMLVVDQTARRFDTRCDAWLYNVPQARTHPTVFDLLDRPKRICMAHGLNGRDATYAAMVPNSDHLRHYLFPSSGHVVAKHLSSIGVLSKLIGAAFENKPEKMDQHADTALGYLKGTLPSPKLLARIAQLPEIAQNPKHVPSRKLIQAIRRDTQLDTIF